MKNNIKKHKLTAADIKKTPNVQIEHTIIELKRYEKRMIFCFVTLFLLMFLSIGAILSKPIKNYLELNEYKTGKLFVNYSNTKDGIDEFITLSDSDILNDEQIKNKETYKFEIKNNSKSSAKYQIIIREDTEIIELDKCSDKTFDTKNIKYNLNKGNVNILKTKLRNNKYILMEDIIPAESIKSYSLNVWLDSNTKKEDKHFHGIIEVDMID